jgi:gamma-glutamyltranspeptidase/glutathione hydrolase
MAAAGHYAAAHAAFLVLEAGGNAVDAGVAGGLVLGVTQSDIVNFAGVAPIMIRMAQTGRVLTIDGLGVWPRRADVAKFRDEFGGAIPPGLLRTVTPAAPSAWLTALRDHGTMRFADVAGAALRLARDGFPVHPTMAEFVAAKAQQYARFPRNAALFLPGGKPLRVGDILVQPELADTIQILIDAEKAASSRGREGALDAAHDAFYRGDIAQAIAAYHAAEGGWLSRDDLASFRVRYEAPVSTRWKDLEILTCGPWCQGPVLGQILAILDGSGIEDLPHNSADYIHLVTEAMKLAFADREAFYGDPACVDVPLSELLSSRYGAQQRDRIVMDRAAPAMPAPGMPVAGGAPGLSPDTSYIAVIDRYGNVFSATPSDSSFDTPLIPGLGICPSSRGSQSFTQEGHPSCVAPGRRPRLTPNPCIALRDDGSVMAFGTPGGDVQTQAMLQFILNVTLHGMDLGQAVDAPRFATYSFPSSFEPHEYWPGRLSIEGRVAQDVLRDLAARGHQVVAWPVMTAMAGAVCAVARDAARACLVGSADVRRVSHVVGW